MVGREHFVDVRKDGPISNNVMGTITHVVYCHVVAYVARYNTTFRNAGRDAQIMVLKDNIAQRADSDKAEEFVVPHQLRVKLV
jgi:hypothetical protein